MTELSLLRAVLSAAWTFVFILCSNFPSLIPRPLKQNNPGLFSLLTNHTSAGGTLCSQNTVDYFYHFSGCFSQPPFSCSLLLKYIIARCHGWWLINLPLWVTAASLGGKWHCELQADSEVMVLDVPRARDWSQLRRVEDTGKADDGGVPA